MADHLCDSCESRVNFPECMPDDPAEIRFEDNGVFPDAVTKCSNFPEVEDG